MSTTIPLLLVTIKTLDGKEDKFYYNNGNLFNDFNLGPGIHNVIHPCDSMGNKLSNNKTKWFNQQHIVSITSVEVEPTPEPVFTQISINNVFSKEQQELLDWADKANIGD